MEGSVAIIAGASSGIGLACVSSFLDSGWRVAGLARSQVSSETRTFLGISVDLTSEKSTKNAFSRVLTNWGRIDAVIHSVGDIYESLPVKDLPWSRWQKTADICLGTAVNLVAHSFEAIQASGGAYVFISSVGSRKGYPGIADYCAMKAALESFCRSVAAELAECGARANTVSPAVVDTPLFRRSLYTVEQAASWHRLGRIGQPKEIADVVQFLASDKGRWITGRNFVVDGGMLL